MNANDKPTMPPGPADAAADRFARERLALIEKRTNSGVLRLIAEAWAQVSKGE
jgi:hypothetical protein